MVIAGIFPCPAMLAISPSAPQFLLGLALLPCVAEGKLQSGSIVLGGVEATDRWQYVTKFGFGLGVGTYEVRLRLRQPLVGGADVSSAQLQLEAFLDEEWTWARALPVCQRARDGPARGVLTLDLAPAGEWGPWRGGQVAHVVRSHIWYFAISNCQGVRGNLAPMDVDFEMRMRQFDQSELSVEMMYMPVVSIMTFVWLTTFLCSFAARCYNLMRSIGFMHPVIRVLAVAIFLQWAAEAFNMFHLLVYQKNGIGFCVADALAEVCFMLSQVISSTLLIAIAQGYTLRRSSTAPLLLLRLMAVVVAVFHVMLVGLDKVQVDESDRHHENEGAVGWFILAARIALYAWFMVGVQALQQKGGFKLQSFLQRFQLAGSAYFLAYPVIFIVVQLFAPYLRHPLMELGLLTMQTAAAVWLADLFLSRGAYFEVSQLGSSLLPGGTGSMVTVGLKKDD